LPRERMSLEERNTALVCLDRERDPGTGSAKLRFRVLLAGPGGEGDWKGPIKFVFEQGWRGEAVM